MKTLTNPTLERCRVKEGPMASTAECGNNGLFIIPLTFQGKLVSQLAVIVSDGMGWDHVSVSCQDRVPSWYEMQFVKDLFWYEEDCVVQFHPPKSRYKNHCEHCLHLWMKQGSEFELPPDIMV